MDSAYLEHVSHLVKYQSSKKNQDPAIFSGFASEYCRMVLFEVENMEFN